MVQSLNNYHNAREKALDTDCLLEIKDVATTLGVFEPRLMLDCQSFQGRLGTVGLNTD